MKYSNPVKRGQFWHNRLGQLVFITNTKWDTVFGRRNIYFIYANYPQLASGRSEKQFLKMYTLEDDREVILAEHLPTMLALAGSKKTSKILRYKGLLTEEERGLLMLNLLNKGED